MQLFGGEIVKDIAATLSDTKLGSHFILNQLSRLYTGGRIIRLDELGQTFVVRLFNRL